MVNGEMPRGARRCEEARRRWSFVKGKAEEMKMLVGTRKEGIGCGKGSLRTVSGLEAGMQGFENLNPSGILLKAKT